MAQPAAQDGAWQSLLRWKLSDPSSIDSLVLYMVGWRRGDILSPARSAEKMSAGRQRAERTRF